MLPAPPPLAQRRFGRSPSALDDIGAARSIRQTHHDYVATRLRRWSLNRRLLCCASTEG